MDKYKDKAKERLGNEKNMGQHKIHPQALAAQQLAEGKMSSQVLENFFTTAYGEILVDYFMAWLQTDHHEVKTREFLYSSAMALGDVKSRLMRMETLSNNLVIMKEMEEDNE